MTYEDVREIIMGHPMLQFPRNKNSWVEEIIRRIKCGEITPQAAIDAAEEQEIEAHTKEQEKWMLSAKRLNINLLKKELRREGFVCKEVWQDNRVT